MDNHESLRQKHGFRNEKKKTFSNYFEKRYRSWLTNQNKDESEAQMWVILLVEI